ncbi:hypothetical protein CEXT_256551 [Caerostris extrusa]|uniref:Uncharacterized protein n=1 Tax=Caerostris extrusa TaxID=172846 RepID=A0AAV4RC16_CAEEX|nr:hypothetical protein CEXT_256551 [Caerostris extrusa]
MSVSLLRFTFIWPSVQAEEKNFKEHFEAFPNGEGLIILFDKARKNECLFIVPFVIHALILEVKTFICWQHMFRECFVYFPPLKIRMLSNPICRSLPIPGCFVPFLALLEQWIL